MKKGGSRSRALKNVPGRDTHSNIEEELALSKAQLEAIFNSITDTVIFTDTERRVLMANPALTATFGYTFEEIAGKTTEVLYADKETFDKIGQLRFSAGAEDGRKPLEILLRRRDGTVFVAEVLGTKVRDPRGAVIGYLGVARDITERKRVEENLKRSNERLAEAQELAHIGSWEWDIPANTVVWSDEVYRIFGLKPNEFTASYEAFLERVHPEDRRSVEEIIKGTLRDQKPVSFYHRAMRPDGAVRVLHCNGRVSSDPSGRPLRMLGTVQDVTEQKQLEATIRYQAYYDMLTGLPNRTLFLDHLALAVAQAQHNRRQVAVIYVDLDRFKNINDSLGHTIGNRLLQEVAARLRDTAPEAVTISSIGGDEYALLLPQSAGEEETARTARKVLSEIRRPLPIDSHRIHITASIGISIYPNDSEDPETLLSNADIAMSQIKERGGDGYQFFDKWMNLRVLERIRIEHSLRLTLEHGEFALYYQPQIAIDSRRLTGVEALIRWRHPQLGLIEPMQFIDIAEDTGLIVPIGEWVLRAACGQIREWQKAGLPPVCVSVNLSARQFEQPDLVETIVRILEETGLDSKCLDIEITESTAMKNIEATMPKLAALSDLGIHFAIDDFGTGYSSLSYLKKLPITKLKIDKSLISDLAADPDYKAIVQAVIVMAHNLKLQVIAEGVETEEQLEFLHSNKCDEMQGYLFSRPLPPEEMEKLLLQK